MDTPGIHQAKNKLGQYMVGVAERSMKDVDLILWLIEPDTKVGGGDRHILKELEQIQIPVFLVINKIDMVKKEKILAVIDTYRGEYDFDEILPVCARSGDGCKDLIESIFSRLPQGPMFYDEDTVTDQPMRQIAAEIIREKALYALDKEVPHGIAVAMDVMKRRPGRKLWDIEATIICERESHKGIIIGKRGAMLKRIGSDARYELERMLSSKVNLRLFVKVKENWRDSDFLIRNFGYRREDEQ